MIMIKSFMDAGVDGFLPMKIRYNGVCADRVNGLRRRFHLFELVDENDIRSAFVKTSCRAVADTAGTAGNNGLFPFKGKSLFCIHG